ncbi:MAG: aminotransferase class V-fold PLP-dependent enzyme, partial [Candidatus Micrarchaeota archaeon]
GPVSVKKQILRAQTKEMITHRGKQYQELYRPIIEELKKMLNAESVHILTGSGTAAIEANIQNALPNNGKALVLSNGAFGDRLYEHCKLYYDTKFERLKGAKGWELQNAKQIIDNAAQEGVQLLAIVHHETSPGILNKFSEICNYAKSKGMLTLVDGTSAFPAYPLNHKQDCVDFYSFASQKALGCPPGISIVSLSQDAINAINSSPVRCNYLNLKAFEKKQNEKFENPNTPAISLIYALHEALSLLKKEGHEKFMKKHKRWANYARKEIKKMGFETFVEKKFQSNTIIPFYTSKNKELNSLLQKKYGVKLGGGHADWKETSLRFCIMGDLNMAKIKKGLKALENAKKELSI